MAEYGDKPPTTVTEERDALLAERAELLAERTVLEQEIQLLHERLGTAVGDSARLLEALSELVEAGQLTGLSTAKLNRLHAAEKQAAELIASNGTKVDEYEKILEAAGNLPEAIAVGRHLGIEVHRLTALLNTPELHDFAKAVMLEAAHQRERWGSEHDQGKLDLDWFWLIGYLAQKACYPDVTHEKKLHRIITVAAAAANWHAALEGKTTMRPGIATPPGTEEPSR